MSFDIHKAVREQQQEDDYFLIKKISQWKPWVSEELLGMFWSADPSIFIWEIKGHLRVVSDKKRREVWELIWVDIVTLRDQKYQGLDIPESNIDLKFSDCNIETTSMSEAELSIYCSLYFSDKKARNILISLFMREKENHEDNLKLNLHNLYENEKRRRIYEYT